MIETEHTPNPDTLKFLPGKKVSEAGPVEFLKNEKNINVSLANKILSLKGTLMVFFGEDFITVKKEKNLLWENLKYGIISEINDYYLKGNDVIIKKDSNIKISEINVDGVRADNQKYIHNLSNILQIKIKNPNNI